MHVRHGLTITEAAMYHNPMRRAGWADWLTVQACDCAQNRAGGKHSECPEPWLQFPENVEPKLTRRDILANDWEVIT